MHIKKSHQPEQRFHYAIFFFHIFLYGKKKLHNETFYNISGKYPAIPNLSKTEYVTWQPIKERRLLHLHENALSHRVTQLVMWLHWVNLCTVAYSMTKQVVKSADICLKVYVYASKDDSRSKAQIKFCCRCLKPCQEFFCK